MNGGTVGILLKLQGAEYYPVRRARQSHNDWIAGFGGWNAESADKRRAG
jgi:hypothetical protein